MFDGSTPVKVTFAVKNTGNRSGAEIAQLYVGQENPAVDRPIKELKGFEKVYLQPVRIWMDPHVHAVAKKLANQEHRRIRI